MSIEIMIAINDSLTIIFANVLSFNLIIRFDAFKNRKES